MFNEFPTARIPERQRPTGFGRDWVTRLERGVGWPCSGVNRILCPDNHGNSDERRNDPSHIFTP